MLAKEAFADPLVVLRGDSTLRAHVHEEWSGLRDALFLGIDPPLLLVPALPAAGRVTIGGVQMLVGVDGTLIPAHDSPYAADPILGYSTAYLPDWADERSGGFFGAGDARVVNLAELRENGAARIVESLSALAELGRPAVCAVDAETDSDVAIAAAGLLLATEAGVPVIARGSPAFSAALAGCEKAVRPARLPAGYRGAVLVVCGSHVPLTTRQLGTLEALRPGTAVELDLGAVLGPHPEAEVERVVSYASRQLEHERLAVVATPRLLDDSAGTVDDGLRIASTLALVARELRRQTAVVIAKGGITSAIVAREGLGARTAWVEGTLVPESRSGASTGRTARHSWSSPETSGRTRSLPSSTRSVPTDGQVRGAASKR